MHLLLQRLSKSVLFCLRVFILLISLHFVEYTYPMSDQFLNIILQCGQDIRSVERIQRFFTRAIFKQVKLHTMSYADRLLHLGFHSLSPYGTSGNSIKLSPVCTSHHNFRSNFFSVRIVNIWNFLTSHCCHLIL